MALLLCWRSGGPEMAPNGSGSARRRFGRFYERILSLFHHWKFAGSKRPFCRVRPDDLWSLSQVPNFLISRLLQVSFQMESHQFLVMISCRLFIWLLAEISLCDSARNCKDWRAWTRTKRHQFLIMKSCRLFHLVAGRGIFVRFIKELVKRGAVISVKLASLSELKTTVSH